MKNSKFLALVVGILSCVLFFGNSRVSAGKFENSTNFEDLIKFKELSKRMEAGDLKTNNSGEFIKCCFSFSSYEMSNPENSDLINHSNETCMKVNEFARKLSEAINEDVELDWFIGKRLVYVSVDKYKEALIKGLEIMNRDYSDKLNCCCWVDGYDELRSIREFN